MLFHKYVLVFSLMVFLFANSASAANFRCNGRFVDGYSKHDLLSSCGEPIYIDSYIKSSKLRSGICERVDQWFYVNPETQTNYVLDIERGFVRRVRRGRM